MRPGSNLQEEQLKDPDIGKIIALKSNHQPRPPFFVWAHNPTLRAFCIVGTNYT